MSDAEAAKKAKAYDQAKELELIDLRGASYDDERWERLISQMTTSEVGKMIGLAGYKTDAAKSINKPKAIDLDGPSGLNNMVAHKPYSITYPAEVNIAASWNTDIAYGWGENVGMDGLRENVLCSGWYAPAMNIHRTPFAGRNFEYYSEDAFLTGITAAYVTKGMQSKGVFPFLKHFALNDQETDRSGIATFCNEQAIREIYLKPFELGIREGKANGLMSSFNLIGLTTSASYATNIQLYTNEFGYKGATVTDFWSAGATGWNGFNMVRGLQFPLGTSSNNASAKLEGVWDADANVVKVGDTASYTQWYWARETAKRILYVHVNSAAFMDGLIPAQAVSAATTLEGVVGTAIPNQTVVNQTYLNEFYGRNNYTVW